MRQRQDGFSLIEVVAAFVILSGCLITCLAVQMRLADAAGRFREEMHVLRIAGELRARLLLGTQTGKEGVFAAPDEAYEYQVSSEPIEYPGIVDLVVRVTRVADRDLPVEQRKTWTLHSAVRAGEAP